MLEWGHDPTLNHLAGRHTMSLISPSEVEQTFNKDATFFRTLRKNSFSSVSQTQASDISISREYFRHLPKTIFSPSIVRKIVFGLSCFVFTAVSFGVVPYAGQTCACCQSLHRSSLATLREKARYSPNTRRALLALAYLGILELIIKSGKIHWDKNTNNTLTEFDQELSRIEI